MKLILILQQPQGSPQFPPVPVPARPTAHTAGAARVSTALSLRLGAACPGACQMRVNYLSLVFGIGVWVFIALLVLDVG